MSIGEARRTRGQGTATNGRTDGWARIYPAGPTWQRSGGHFQARGTRGGGDTDSDASAGPRVIDIDDLAYARVEGHSAPAAHDARCTMREIPSRVRPRASCPMRRVRSARPKHAHRARERLEATNLDTRHTRTSRAGAGRVASGPGVGMVIHSQSRWRRLLV